MYVIAIIIGLALGMAFWFAASYFVASSILWAESRYPRLVNSRGMRVGEVAACATLVLLCFAIAFAVARLIIQK